MDNTEVIDLRLIIKKIGKRKTLFFKVLPVVFVVSVIYILGFPRYYTTDAKLVPEMGISTSGGALGSLVSSFGFDLNNMQTEDAISPILYPDLMEDNEFVTGLFNIKVISQDKKIKTSYHDYLKKYQEPCIWDIPMSWIKRQFKTPPKHTKTSHHSFNPYILSEEENDIANAVRNNIQFSLNEKNGVITIRTKAQDPLICKILADSISSKLQAYITTYRTNKARIDFEYYKKLTSEARMDYEKARQRYAHFSDGSMNPALRSVELKLEEMESEMELKFSNYSNLNNQLQAAKAKVQERTPAFTIIKGADVPLKPAGPKRMLFVLFMLIFASIIITIIITRDDIIKIIEVHGKKS